MRDMEEELGSYFVQHLTHRTHWNFSLHQVQADSDFPSGEVDITLDHWSDPDFPDRAIFYHHRRRSISWRKFGFPTRGAIAQMVLGGL